MLALFYDRSVQQLTRYLLKLLNCSGGQFDGCPEDGSLMAGSVLGRHGSVSVRCSLPRLSTRVPHVPSSETRVDDARKPQ